MKRFMFVVSLCALPSLLFAQSSGWTDWRGPNGDASSTETGWNPLALKGGARILWKADVGMGHSSVAIKDNHLYTMGVFGNEWTFSCLDATTGLLLWRTPMTGRSVPTSQSTPATDGERVYGLGADGSLVCLRALDGIVLWEKNLQIDFNATKPTYNWGSSLVIDEKLLLVNANTRGIALDKVTGMLVWATPASQSQGHSGSYATTVVRSIEGHRCAVFLGATVLTIVEVATGRTLWSFAPEESDELYSEWSPVPDPIIFDDKLLLQFGLSCIQLAVSGSRLNVQWKASSFNSPLTAGVLVNGFLYGSCWPIWQGAAEFDDIKAFKFPFSCVDWRTGDVVWEKQMKYVSTRAAGGKLLLLEVSGTLHIAEVTPSGYEELSSADVLDGVKRPRTFATPPVLNDGRIYCRNFAGDLVCIDVRS